MLLSRYTKHSHYRSPYETDNSCRNCDGADCEHCHLVYYSSYYDTAVYEKEDKEKIESIDSILAKYANPHDPFSIYPILAEDNIKIEGKLVTKEDKKLLGEIYYCLLNKAISAANHYRECTCEDRDTADGGDCLKHGCTDFTCYCKMKNGHNTKLWYM